MPSVSGNSGPTTVRSICCSNAHLAQRLDAGLAIGRQGQVLGQQRVPGLPGAQ